MAARSACARVRHITTKWPEMDWFEIVSENFIDTEGRPLYFLDQVAEDQSLTLRVVRGTDELTVTVTFGESGAQRVGSA